MLTPGSIQMTREERAMSAPVYTSAINPVEADSS